MNFKISSLGSALHKSPLVNTARHEGFFQSDSERMYYDVRNRAEKTGDDNSCELAGPREKIFFPPEAVKSAIVTCGGLCPGINDVIRSIVMASYYSYGCKTVLGILYGYRGFFDVSLNPVELTPRSVSNIHREGGTVLGSSRGGTEDMELLVDSIAGRGINILYTIGGDGTLKGAQKINEIARRRGLDIAVVGIPKTIDNDICYIQKSFGFETAYSRAVESIVSAHVEAIGAPGGIGIVKLMGRHSGFIAANATLAMNDVNFLLVPEVDFDLDGPNGFLKHLADRMARRGHALICVAEGAGQRHISVANSAHSFDASGNVVLDDIGIFLKQRISRYFKEKKIEVNIKYIDPSYMIRSAPAVPADSIYCTMLGQNAVHAAMSGKTGLIIGLWNNIYCHIPIEMAVSQRKLLSSRSRFWYSVIEATGQPFSMLN